MPSMSDNDTFFILLANITLYTFACAAFGLIFTIGEGTLFATVIPLFCWIIFCCGAIADYFTKKTKRQARNKIPMD